MKKQSSEPLNAQAAIEAAQEANELAFAARIIRDAKNELLYTISALSVLFNNGAVLVSTLIFLLAIVVEVNFSFAMYEDLAQASGQLKEVMAYIAAFFIVALAAKVSHLIAKALSGAMFRYAVTNMVAAHNGDIPYNAAKEEIKKLRRRDLIYGLIIASVLIAVVYAISFQRIHLLGVIYKREYDGIHRYLPVFAIIIEMLTGIYLAYFWKRLTCEVELAIKKRRFKKLKKACVHFTKMAVTYYEYATTQKEYISLAKDMVDALFRWKYRSLDSEEYVDAVDGIKTLTVIVMDGKLPVANIHLTGSLINNRNCSSVDTNEAGEGILTWLGDENEVLSITAGGDVFNGPWRANSSVTIYLRKIRRIKAA